MGRNSKLKRGGRTNFAKTVCVMIMVVGTVLLSCKIRNAKGFISSHVEDHSWGNYGAPGTIVDFRDDKSAGPHAEGVHYSKLDTAFEAVRKMAVKLNQTIKPTCDIEAFGIGYGHHMLCNYRPVRPCYFYSFGVGKDYSFDLDVANRWGCHGFAADPTVVHPSKLHPNITFHSMAAKALTGSKFPLTTTVTAVRHWLRHSHLAVVKMDCEGCEYSLGIDIALEDPDFFSHVDQFAVEIHVSKHWLKTQGDLYSLGLLYLFLETAGLELQHAQVTSCNPKHEQEGCLDELLQMNYPCGMKKSCHNYLFARSTELWKKGIRE